MSDMSPGPPGQSEEERSKEALRISEARHRLLADSASDVIWTMAPDGRVTYVSPAIEKVRGYTPEEAMAHTVDQTLTPDSAAKSTGYFIQILTDIQAGRTPEPFRGDLEYLCKDGSTLFTEARMPKMSGTDLVGALIADGIDLPVLFVSGQLSVPLPTDWPASAPRRFLAKPFTLDQLQCEMSALQLRPK